MLLHFRESYKDGTLFLVTILTDQGVDVLCICDHLIRSAFSSEESPSEASHLVTYDVFLKAKIKQIDLRMSFCCHQVGSGVVVVKEFCRKTHYMP